MCYLDMRTGTLEVDPKYGTALAVPEGNPDSGPFIVRLGIMWPHGFTARRAGLEVEVVNLQGKVVALTGRRYTIYGQAAPIGMWSACPDVTPA